MTLRIHSTKFGWAKLDVHSANKRCGSLRLPWSELVALAKCRRITFVFV